MKICIIAEGCYPYVTGGVSSWIQMLINYMPQHEFIIYAIGADQKQKGVYKIKLPPNVVEVRETFINISLDEELKINQSYNLTPDQEKALYSLISCEDVNWKFIFELFYDSEKSPLNFLLSDSYMSIIEKICSEKYPYVAFSDFFWNARSMAVSLLKIIQNKVPEADVYHCVSTGYAGIIASLAKWRYNKPVILSEHGIYAREREEEIIKADWVVVEFKAIWIKFFYLLADEAYLIADSVTSLFDRARKTQIELGCMPSKTLVIHNGIKYENYDPSTHTYENKNPIVIGAIVRVVPIKDIKTMLYTFSYVKEIVPNAKFFIFGPYEEDPEYYNECIQLMGSLKLKDAEFTGFANIPKRLEEVDISVLTSISEGQPLSHLEAMASSVPIVTTDVGCCRELIYGEPGDDLGSCGIVVPVMNPVAASEAIIKLIKKPNLRKEMGEIALERVKKYYSLSDCFDTFIDLYERPYDYGGN